MLIRQSHKLSRPTASQAG